MLMPALLYIAFCFTATGGIYWIALETSSPRAAKISAVVTFVFFIAVGWALLRFVIPQFKGLTL
ncbi:MAG: hypothetical protein KDD11_10425 [Acidobacteria bacterium]|nr:hypothetical protein [Acidobacteriota bacterium]